MSVVRRVLANDLRAQIQEDATQPFALVRLGFADNVQRFSTGPEVVWDGHTWLEGLVRIGTITHTPDGEQSVEIAILNPDNIATAIVLNYGVKDVPVDIYEAHLDANGDLMTPELLARGVLVGDQITPAEVMLVMQTERTTTEYQPNRFFTPANGFNHLPRRGAVIIWGQEKYVLGEAD